MNVAARQGFPDEAENRWSISAVDYAGAAGGAGRGCRGTIAGVFAQIGEWRNSQIVK
jgi:hypothetical protein